MAKQTTLTKPTPSTDPLGDYKQKQLAGLFGGKDYVAPQTMGVDTGNTESVKDPKPATPWDSKSYTATQPDEYDQLMSRLNSDKEQQDLETARRKKRAQLFAAIGDGLASLSNLFFTTKYAPNAYNPAYSLSEATKRRYDELQAKGDAEFRDKVRERIGDLQRKRAERIAQANAAAERADKEREYQIKQADLLRKAKADEAKKQLEQDKLRMKQEVDASTIARNNAQARYYRNGGAGSGRRGSGNGGQWNTETTTTVYDKNGNVVEETKHRSNKEPKEVKQGRFNQKKSNITGKGGW